MHRELQHQAEEEVDEERVGAHRLPAELQNQRYRRAPFAAHLGGLRHPSDAF